MQHIQTSTNFPLSLVCVSLLPWCLPSRTLYVSDLICDQMSRSPFDPTKTNSERCKRFAQTVNQPSNQEVFTARYQRCAADSLSLCVCVRVCVASCEDRPSPSLSHTLSNTAGLTVGTIAASPPSPPWIQPD